MDYLIEAFEPAFMQRALIGGLIAVVATSFVGTWVVLRGLAFLGDALAHGVIPGVALAGLWGFNPLIGAFAAALVMSGLVSVVSTRTIVRDETAIGLLFVGMLSLGIIVISTAQSFATDVSGLLFGDILGVTRADIRTQAIVAAVVTVAMFVLHRPLMALAFNRSKATTLRMHPALTHAALLGLLALSIVASFQAIGTMLVFGLIVAPPATASLLVRRVPPIMALSMLLGGLCVVAGLAISFHHGTAGGATITGLSVALFFVIFIGSEARRYLQNRRYATVQPVG